MKCSRCFWWDEKGVNLPPHPSDGMTWAYRPCLNPALHRDGYMESAIVNECDRSGAGVIYVNSDDVWFATGPDFGCVHFQQS